MVVKWATRQIERICRYWSPEYEWHVTCESCGHSTVVDSKEDAVYVGLSHEEITLKKCEI